MRDGGDDLWGPPALDDAERAHLAGLGRLRTLATDMALCREGAPAGDVYLIESGSVRVVRASLTGRELIMATRRAGDLVGELSAFDGQLRSASVIANESTTVVSIPGDRFRRAVTTRPQLAALFLQELAIKVRDADGRTMARDGDDVRTRVVARLTTLADARPPDATTAATAVSVPLTQSELASWVGASRETVARVLADLRAADLVRTGRGSIEIIDVDRLRRAG